MVAVPVSAGSCLFADSPNNSSYVYVMAAPCPAAALQLIKDHHAQTAETEISRWVGRVGGGIVWCTALRQMPLPAVTSGKGKGKGGEEPPQA